MKCIVMLNNVMKDMKFINILLVSDYDRLKGALMENCSNKETPLLEEKLYYDKLVKKYQKFIQTEE